MHETIGARLTAWRESLSLSQKGAAAHLGISASTYQNYERGVREPNASACKSFADAGINTNWLLTGEGSMLICYQPGSSTTVLTVEQPRAEYTAKRSEIDAVLLSGVIAAVDMANPQLGASERAAIAAKAYAEAVSAAKPDQDSNFFSP